MKYDLYLKRQKMSLEKLIEVKKIESYVELQNYFKSIGIKFSNDNQEIKNLFESNKDENVEEGTIIKSSYQEGRISDQKSSKSKTNDSTSAGRSGTKQRVRKSPAKRQRKSDSNKVESVQPISGSEDTK